MKLLTLALFVTLSLNSFAARDQFEPFLRSLEEHTLLRADHLIDISHDIRLKKMGIFSPRNAEATYSPMTNTISLKKENLVKRGRQYRIKTYQEFATGESYNPFIVKAQTIFHELAHADFDVYLERSSHLPIHKYLTSIIPNWFRQNFTAVNAKTATHELFGYTAGDFIYNINSKILDTLINHGMYHNQDKCFNQNALEKIAKRLGLKEKVEFKDVFQTQDLSDKIIPSFIYINGKSLDIKHLPVKIKAALMNYFHQQYSLATNTRELTDRLNSSNFLARLKKCYEFLKAN